MSKPYWMYGLHSVRAALNNPQRDILRLAATPEAVAKLGTVAHPVETLHRREIDRLLPADAVHQGVAALAQPLIQPDLADLLPVWQRGVVLVLDQVTDPHNVGAILRSAAAFGALAVVTQARHSPVESGVLAKTASGALERIPYLGVTNLSRALEDMQRFGFWCVALDSDATDTLEGLDTRTGKWALVLGAEGKGVRQGIRAHCDHLVRLPTLPDFGSLNVSNAAAVALYAFRQ